MRASGDGVGLATVYRTLQQLADDGELDVVRSTDNETMYRRCSSGHHHHLVCRYCRRTVEVDSVAVERWAARMGSDHGFTDVSHVLQHIHHEEPFDDFERQPLLPRRLSQLGPGVSWFDLDGDGREDLIIASSTSVTWSKSQAPAPSAPPTGEAESTSDI